MVKANFLMSVSIYIHILDKKKREINKKVQVWKHYVKFCGGSRRELWVQEGKDRNNITIKFLTCTGNFWWVVVDKNILWYLSSVQFSRSVMSDTLWPHELQHARPPCPSPTPQVYSNSCPLSRWCHPAISSSVVPFSSCPQSPCNSTHRSYPEEISVYVYPQNMENTHSFIAKY